MMKKYTIFLLLIFTIFLVTSCGNDNYISNAIAIGYKDDTAYLLNSTGDQFSLKEYDIINDEFGDYITIGKTSGTKTKYGYIKNTGELIIKPKYAWAGLMKENKAVVTTQKNKQLIIDSNGKTLFELPDNMISSSYFQEGRLLVEINGQLAYLDDNFNLLEGRYDYATVFKNGFANVGKYMNKQIKYGFVKSDGSELFEENYIYDFVDHFYNGLARVGQIQSMNNGVPTYSFSYINEEGTPLNINENITYAMNFSSNYALIGFLNSENYMSYRFINTQGEIVISSLHNTQNGDNYIFGDIISDENMYDEMIGVMAVRNRVIGSGSWTTYIIQSSYNEFNNTTSIEADKLYTRYSGLYSEPWATKYSKANAPIDMTNFKITKYYPGIALSKIQMADGKCALIDSLGNIIIDFEFENIIY